MSAVTHPRITPRKGGVRNLAWWAKAWQRAVEEASFQTVDLRAGHKLARAGSVGGMTLDRGSALAAVQVGDDAWTVTVEVPTLQREAVDTFVELVAAESGRVAALMAGDLPHQLVEQAEEFGVELLPYGGELTGSCSCDHWAQPCRHALAVLTQLTWLVDDDPFTLLLLRGLPRQELLAALHARTKAAAGSAAGTGRVDPEVEADVEVALDAVTRAARILEVLESDEPDAGVDHLL